MEENYDVIGVLRSGMPSATELFEALKNRKDTRLLAFYPVNLTHKEFLSRPGYSEEGLHTKLTFGEYMKRNNFNNRRYSGALSKYNNFKEGLHTKIDEYLEKRGNVTDKEIRKLMGPSYWASYSSARENILKTMWLEYDLACGSEEKFSEGEFLEFISNPRKRIFPEPDISRTAILCDDYIYESKTMKYTIYDLFRVGYKKIQFRSELASNDKTYFEGDYENFKKNYDKKDIERVGWDIVKKEYRY